MQNQDIDKRLALLENMPLSLSEGKYSIDFCLDEKITRYYCIQDLIDAVKSEIDNLKTDIKMIRTSHEVDLAEATNVYNSFVQSLKDALKGYQLTTEVEILATINDITTDYIKLVEDCKQMHSFVEEKQSCEAFAVILKAIAMNVNAIKTDGNEKVVDHLLGMIEEEFRKLRI
jgi:cell division protein ZapA (FtsZ GTPase activity inhibitor)